MPYSNRMSVEDYRREINGVHCPRKSSTVHKGNSQPDLEQAFQSAAEALRDLQSTGGDLFLGHSPFDLRIEIHGETQADGANVYKAVEDALNQLAWFDDKQNVHFRAKKLCECED